MVGKIISCVYEAVETIDRFCGKRSVIANAQYVSKNPFINKLWIFLFNKVKETSTYADIPETVSQIVKASGNVFLPGRPLTSNLRQISEHVTKANFHIYIIRAHIATEIWYNIEICIGRNDEREFSKILSDYMLYLLLNQPNVMSAVATVGIAQKKSADTLRELRHLIISDETKDLERISKKLYNRVGPRAGAVLGGINHSESPLDGGLHLARELEDFGKMKWNILSRQWVAMLQYAAVNIKGEAHVQVLSKGGELLAFVWLLMAHFGCFYKPEWGMYYEFWDEWSKLLGL